MVVLYLIQRGSLLHPFPFTLLVIYDESAFFPLWYFNFIRLTQLMLVPEVQGVSSKIILVAHLNRIRDPHPHNSPQNLIFHSQPRKVRFWLIKVIDKDTLVSRFPHEHVFSTDCNPLLTLRNPQFYNKCNWWPVVSHVLWWDHDRTAQNSLLEGAGRLPLLFPTYL